MLIYKILIQMNYGTMCQKHGCRRHTIRVLLARNQSNILFPEENILNSLVTYNFRQGHRLIIVDPNQPRHFRLNTINREQMLAINDL